MAGGAPRSEAVRRAHQVIENAWTAGRPYDLASQAAFALESAQLLQSPETAAELTARRTEDLRLRGELAPATGARAVPFELGDSLLPAVKWLIARVDVLEAAAREPVRARWDRAVSIDPEDGAVTVQCVDIDDPKRGVAVLVDMEFREPLADMVNVCDCGATVCGCDEEPFDAPQPELTVYRAQHDSIPMGLYTTRQAAYEHCEAHEMRDDPVMPFSWKVDEDGVAELWRFGTCEGVESPTGFVVTPLLVSSEFDPEVDE